MMRWRLRIGLRTIQEHEIRGWFEKEWLMAAKRPRPVKPVNAALTRLLALAAKGVVPLRMAREVEGIVAEWQAVPEADPYEIRERLGEMREQLMQGVADAEEQVSDTDAADAPAVKQAAITLAALVATRDAAARAMAGLG
jgi:malonyl CoA-acyl carrier protein transacylase